MLDQGAAHRHGIDLVLTALDLLLQFLRCVPCGRPMPEQRACCTRLLVPERQSNRWMAIWSGGDGIRGSTPPVVASSTGRIQVDLRSVWRIFRFDFHRALNSALPCIENSGSMFNLFCRLAGQVTGGGRPDKSASRWRELSPANPLLPAGPEAASAIRSAGCPNRCIFNTLPRSVLFRPAAPCSGFRAVFLLFQDANPAT